MRVYEFAKLLNVTNKDLLTLLAQNGFEVKSHMAALSSEATEFLNKKLEESKTPISESKQEKKAETPTIVIDKPSVQKDFTVKVAGPLKKVEIKEAAHEFKHKEHAEIKLSPQPKEIIKEEKPMVIEISAQPMTVGQLADKFGKTSSELILALLRQGVVCAKNQTLSEKMVESLAKQFGISIMHKQAAKQEISQRVLVTSGEHVRKPIVVVIGHVDHGKTTLLDFIRKTRVASREKGGITQHLGAYEAQTPQGSLVFLDTPGHEAFKNIRGRGLNIADIAILVVAADDSVMPQTVEAIKTAQAAQVPIIVAINKVDKVDKQRLEVVKRDLARYELVSEEWGGQTICVPISAKTGQGIDQLLEMIVLQSQMMDLRANEKQPADGFVLESKIEKGRGPVATIICRHGTLHVGDFFVSGTVAGKVTSIASSNGQQLKQVGPSIPVQVSGIAELAQAGEIFKVVSEQEYRKARDSRSAISQLIMPKKVFGVEGLNIIIKTDSVLTQEALLDSLMKVADKNRQSFNVIAAGVGDISESDVTLASDTGAEIIGLHVKVESNAAIQAQKLTIRIHLYDIIYKLLEALEEQLETAAPIKMVAKKIGEAVVRKVFDIKNIGIIAGSYVKEGRFVRDARVIVWRGKRKIGEGKIKGLERDRKSVKEVHAGFEFAFLADGIETWEIDDRVECFIEVPENK